MSNIVLATITWVRTPGEGDLLFRGLEALSQIGLPVVAADGGSPPEWRERASALPNVSMHQRGPDDPGLVGQVRVTLREARSLGTEWVFYTEPDKVGFFQQHLARVLQTVESEHAGAGMVVVARDAESFATFPAGQRTTETLFNALAGSWLGIAADTLYGPLLIRADLCTDLESAPLDLGWGWRPWLMAACRKQGRPLAVVTSHFPCPEDQRGEDDRTSRLYRMQQLEQNVRGLRLGLAE